MLGPLSCTRSELRLHVREQPYVNQFPEAVAVVVQMVLLFVCSHTSLPSSNFLSAVPTEPGSPVAEFEPAPHLPGVTAGTGSGIGSHPPREHTGDRDFSASSPGSGSIDELST